MENEGTKINSLSERRFSSIVFLLRLGGIPIKMKKISTIYTVYMATLTFSSIATAVGMFFDIYVHWNNLGRAMSTMRVLFPLTDIIWIHNYCRLQRQNIERAVDLTDSFTWEDLPTRDTDTGQLTAAGWIPTIKMFSARVAIFFMCIHFVQSTIRIVTNHETQFNVWYPFDWTASPFYELVNISQGFTTLLATGLTFGFMSLCATLIAVACTQFDKLKAAILDIRQQHITPYHGQENEQFHTIANCELQAKLNACIQHHQDIMAFIQHLEDALNIGLCGHFLILLATMCFAAFGIVTNWGDYVDMTQAVIIYTAFCMVVLLICWCGTQLTQHIMQKTLSFFMFLLQVKDKSEGTTEGK